MTALLDAALAWHDAGASVLPAGREKIPARPWKDHQTERLSATELTELMLTGKYDGIGLVTGYGGFEMFELEGRAAHLLPELIAKLPADLTTRLLSYAERSPKGGYHFIYRVDGDQEGSTKLAYLPDLEAPTGWSVAIETRGNPAWTVLAPSGGNVHDLIPGGKWEIIYGSPGAVPTLTADEVDVLFEASRSFDQMPPPEPIEHRPARANTSSGELAPGEDFNLRADWMADVLGPDGWTIHSRAGDVTYLTRPGKRHGKSASLGFNGYDNLWIFTSSLEPTFSERSSWTKFGYYAQAHHEGDWAEAARELRRQGYGSPPKVSTAMAESRATLSLIHGGATGPTTSGANALAPREEDSSPATTLQHSEDGHAQLLIHAYGAVIRYAVEMGKWLWWDGGRWHAQDKGGMVRELVKDVARTFPEDSPSALRHKARALGSTGTSGCLVQASTDVRVVISINDLDARPRELNTPGGILDLPTKTLLPHDPAHLHTLVTRVTPDWDGNRKLWDDFLEQTFGGDAELIAWVQRVVGYSAVGEVGPHVLPFCMGSGGNGKGVFLEAIMAVLGDYAVPAPNDFLMAGRDRHATEIADLAGKRMVVCSEVNEDDRFDEAKVKRLTGGDRLKARFIARDLFSFDPTHTLWLVGNHDPEMKSGGRSMERRLAKIPFDHEVSDEDRIDGLKERLVAECGPAILAWIADGAAAYLAGGLGDRPSRVQEATREFTHAADTISQFIEERCKVGGGHLVTVPMADVRRAYEDFCKELGVEARSAKALGQALRKAGVEEGPNRGARGGKTYQNLMLLVAEVEDRTSVQGILV